MRDRQKRKQRKEEFGRGGGDSGEEDDEKTKNVICFIVKNLCNYHQNNFFITGLGKKRRGGRITHVSKVFQ